MIDLREVKNAIDELEHGETTLSNCSKLAVLYSVREHLEPTEEPKAQKIEGYSFGSSEFLTAVASAPIDGVLTILDEHMEAIQLLYPREYSAIISKIKNLSLPR